MLPTLQVEGQPSLFALGDCNNVPEEKKGFLASKQAELAAKSIKVGLKKGQGEKSQELGAVGSRWKPLEAVGEEGNALGRT